MVDVASTDGTTEWLEAARPAVHRTRIAENKGPGPGRNAGIRAASRRFVLLMDADVRVQPEAAQRLHGAMLKDAAVKIASPIVVHASAPDRIQYADGHLHYVCEAIIPWAERSILERGADPEDIGVAATCALLLDREAAIEVGLFDERYFIGKEDGDFTHRVNLAGYRIRELPDAIVLHESRTRGTWLFYYQIRNRWHFILKNYQLRTIVSIVPALVIYEPLQLAVLTAQGHLWTYIRALAGLITMLPTLPADRARVRAIRRRSDRQVLSSAPLIVRGDIARSAIIRHGKPLYDRFLSFYWRVLTEAGARAMKTVTFVAAAVLAFGVYTLVFGVTFFCIGGFLLVHAGRTMLFLAIVFVLAAFMALFTGLLAINSEGLPGSMGQVSQP